MFILRCIIILEYLTIPQLIQDDCQEIKMAASGSVCKLSHAMTQTEFIHDISLSQMMDKRFFSFFF